MTPAMLDKLAYRPQHREQQAQRFAASQPPAAGMHGVAFEQLDQVSPRSRRVMGSAREESVEDIIVKIAELFGTLADEKANETQHEVGHQVAPTS